MKRAGIIAVIMFLAIFASSVNAQLTTELCSVDILGIENTVTDSTTHVKLTYSFKCDSTSHYQGQVTKMVFKVPLTDVENLEASDTFGSMAVLEGPEYVKASAGTTETTIGAFFRKGLRITNEKTGYSISIEFDTNSLAVLGEEGKYTLRPSGLGATPKVTIVTTGLTEMTMPPKDMSYSLKLPDNAAVNQISPPGCGYQDNTVTCNALTAEDIGQLEVKWTQVEQKSFGDKMRGYVEKYVPTLSGTVKDLIKSISESFGK